MKIDNDIYDEELEDIFSDDLPDLPDTYYSGKKGPDSCDEYWDELVGTN